MNCYLLIGGDSRRMGAAKASLMLGGETFVERITRAARESFERVVAIQRAGRPPAPVVETIFEPVRHHQGPAAAILTALEHAAGERVWVLGVDFPLVTPGILRFLRRGFEANRAADIFVPEWDGRPQYLCAGYDTRTAPVLRSSIEQADLSLRRIASQVRTEVAGETALRERFPGDLLRNVNHPSEYDDLVKSNEAADTH